MQSAATTVDEYLASLPPDRREIVSTLLAVVRANLPAGYAEGMAFGMIGWCVPLEVYPDTYNGQALSYAALASQKGHIALYLTNVYASPELRARLEAAYAAAGKKLDMGGSCLRFKRLDEVVLPAVAEVIAATPLDAHVAQAKAVRAATKSAKKPKKAKE